MSVSEPYIKKKNCLAKIIESCSQTFIQNLHVLLTIIKIIRRARLHLLSAINLNLKKAKFER